MPWLRTIYCCSQQCESKHNLPSNDMTNIPASGIYHGIYHGIYQAYAWFMPYNGIQIQVSHLEPWVTMISHISKVGSAYIWQICRLWTIQVTVLHISNGFTYFLSYFLSYSAYHFTYLFVIFWHIFCIYMSNMQTMDLSLCCIFLTYFLTGIIAEVPSWFINQPCSSEPKGPRPHLEGGAAGRDRIRDTTDAGCRSANYATDPYNAKGGERYHIFEELPSEAQRTRGTPDNPAWQGLGFRRQKFVANVKVVKSRLWKRKQFDHCNVTHPRDRVY